VTDIFNQLDLDIDPLLADCLYITETIGATDDFLGQYHMDLHDKLNRFIELETPIPEEWIERMHLCVLRELFQRICSR
jgi:hypothetical protein